MKSTGPKSDAGKAEVAKNPLIHGLRSPNPVLPGKETESEWMEHRQSIVDRLAPEGAVEMALAEQIAVGFWKLARCSCALAEVFKVVCEERKWDAIAAELPYEMKKSHGVEGAFEILKVEAEEAESLSNLWNAVIDHPDETPFDPSETMSLLKSAFNETYVDDKLELLDSLNEWPPSSREAIYKALEWLALGVCGDEPGFVWLARKGKKFRDRAKRLRNKLNSAEKVANHAESMAFLDDRVSVRLPRYETSIHRALLKNLHELQRLQGMRAGLVEVIPRAVDISDA